MNIFQTMGKKLDINAVLNSTAQPTKLCGVVSNDCRSSRDNILDMLRNNNIDKRIRFVIMLQFDYGLRISEILHLDKSNFLGNNKILIKGLKRSYDRLIICNDEFNIYNYYSRLVYKIGDLYSRFFFYRLYRRLGIVFVTGANCNNSVTHSLRVNFVKSLVSSTNDMSFVMNEIGHKNINNTMIYANKKGVSQI